MQIIKIVLRNRKTLFVGPFKTSVRATNYLKRLGFEPENTGNLWKKNGYAHDQGNENYVAATATINLLFPPKSSVFDLKIWIM